MDYFEKIGYNLWLKNKCTWDAYLISRKVEKLIRNELH